MGHIVSKVLQEQYLKLSSLKVDEDKQQPLLQQLLVNLKQHEQKLVAELAPNPALLSNYDQRILESCSDAANHELIENLKSIGEFPRIKLASDIVDYAFQQINSNQKVPALLKIIILSLKPSLFRLALEDYRTLISEHNPIIQTIDILVSYVPLWKDEQKANYPTFKKLVSILDFVETTPNLLAKELEEIVIPIANIRENQQKRSLIFEKRLVERESSAAITKTSQLFIAEILDQVKQQYSLEPFLIEFLEQHWSRLLTLEFVRHDHDSFIHSFKLFIRLIKSLADVSSKQQLNHLIDELPKLKEGLLAGLTKLAVSELEANEFLTEIESRHLKIIQTNSQLPDEELPPDQPTEEHQAHSDGDNRPAVSIDEDDLIRLKPTDFYGTENSQDDQLVEQSDSSDSKKKNSESIQNDEQSRNTAVESNTNSANEFLETKTFLQAIDELVKPTSQATKHIPVSNEALFAKMHKELSELVFTNQSAFESEEINNYVSLNEWYSIKQDIDLHKLIYINENTKQYIFANQMAQKSYTLKIDEINQLYKDNQIIRFEAPNIIASAVKKSLQLYREFLTERKKRTTHDTAQVVDLLKHDSEAISDQNVPNPSPVSLPQTESNSTRQLKAGESPQDSRPIGDIDNVDISSITVGTWISYDLNNRKIKCKLAARIVSKDVYIFVDRKGLKILEQSTHELEQKLISGKIKVVESENSGRLESVIANTRTLKS